MRLLIGGQGGYSQELELAHCSSFHHLFNLIKSTPRLVRLNVRICEFIVFGDFSYNVFATLVPELENFSLVELREYSHNRDVNAASDEFCAMRKSLFVKLVESLATCRF